MPDRIHRHPAVRRHCPRAFALGLVALLGLATATTAACRTHVWRDHQAARSRIHFDDLPPMHDAAAPAGAPPRAAVEALVVWLVASWAVDRPISVAGA